MMQPRSLTIAQQRRLKQVQKEYYDGLAEAAEESGMDEGQIYGDIIVATVWELVDDDMDIAWELCRREYGGIPHDLEGRLR